MRSYQLFNNEESKKREKYLSESRLALNSTHNGVIEINGRQIKLSNEITAGGFKRLFDISDGKVIALRNTNDGLSDLVLYGWEEGVAFEFKMSERLKNLGLYTQDYQQVEVKINGHAVPALIMTHFKNLLVKNQQIRGCSNKEKFGTTMLFGTLENIKSESYFRQLFCNIIDDIVTLIVNKVNLGVDSFGGIVITNTISTPIHDENKPDTINNRKQELHLFLMDFYQKQLLFQHGDLTITDARFNPELEVIVQKANFYLSMASSCVFSAITKFEKNQLQQGKDLNLYELMHETYEKIEDSLLEDICVRIARELKKQKLSRFDHAPPLKRTVSSHSYFYHPKEELMELTLESVQELMGQESPDTDLKKLRNSIG